MRKTVVTILILSMALITSGVFAQTGATTTFGDFVEDIDGFSEALEMRRLLESFILESIISGTGPFGFPPEIKELLESYGLDIPDSGMAGVLEQTQEIKKEFILKALPRNPGPNTEVKVTAVSYAFDMDRASITWFLNGSVAGKGLGRKSFSFRTGDLGFVSSLRVVVVTSDGLQSERYLKFQTAEIDLLWEAETYTPLNYRGKALPSSQSRIKVTAISDFRSGEKRILPSNLIYKWEINGRKFLDDSGVGKSSITFTSSATNGRDVIRVIVEDISGDIKAEKIINIKVGRPKILFYEENPLEGPRYEKALLRNFPLEFKDISLRAEPFFFSKESSSTLSYVWKMNKNKIIPTLNPKIINFRALEGNQGKAAISLELLVRDNIMQSANNSLNIIFAD